MKQVQDDIHSYFCVFTRASSLRFEDFPAHETRTRAPKGFSAKARITFLNKKRREQKDDGKAN
jgi:hypothetical protein